MEGVWAKLDTYKLYEKLVQPKSYGDNAINPIAGFP